MIDQPQDCETLGLEVPPTLLAIEGGRGGTAAPGGDAAWEKCLGPAKRQRGRKTPKAGRSWKALRIFMLLLSAKSSRRQLGLWNGPV